MDFIVGVGEAFSIAIHCISQLLTRNDIVGNIGSLRS
jgi:hypothetical protein